MTVTSHPRQTIRQVLCTSLQDKTMAGNRVFIQRKTPLFEAELPCLLLYTDMETTDRFLQSPRELKRKLSVVLEGIIQTGDHIDDQLDQFAAQIETVLHQDPTLGDHLSDSQLIQTIMDINAQGKQLTGSIILTYEFIYYSRVLQSVAHS